MLTSNDLRLSCGPKLALVQTYASLVAPVRPVGCMRGLGGCPASINDCARGGKLLAGKGLSLLVISVHGETYSGTHLTCMQQRC